MKEFASAAATFAGLGADVVARLAGLAADLCIVVDVAGLVRDASVSSDEIPAALAQSWVGQPIQNIVVPDSRHKLAELLAAGAHDEAVRWRQLNLLADGGAQWMLQCAALRLDAEGVLVVVARSLQSTAVLQQRLVQAQQAMERDYWQFRDAETRYRQLFQSSSEGVLVLEADNLTVLEANPAACRVLELDDSTLVGRPLPACFGADAAAVLSLLVGVRAAGRPAEAMACLGVDRADVLVSATAFRQGGTAQLLVRLVRRGADAQGAPRVDADWAALVRVTPDGVVLTDGDGRVLAANGAFLELAQLVAEEQLRGESLDRWLGRSGVDLSVLLSNLRQRGLVRLFATRLRGELGASTEVEIAAVQVSESPAVLGFTIRDVGRRLSATPRALQELPKSVEQLTELVGRVPMKDIVGETTDLIEQLCIEAALELTRGNRAAAAEMLGLSRQSLYVKLRRYGLKDIGIEDEK
ncbi:MAG: transcriptional regulator PpsR [Rubrivivax sp.]|nr:transcriptional regulator PpsR [Rubrivivax sp.]